MTLEDAKYYFSMAEREGYFVPDNLNIMTDEELIKCAKELGARGDAEIDIER